MLKTLMQYLLEIGEIIQEKINALQTMGIQESSMREFDEFLDNIMPRREMVEGCKKAVAAPKKGRKFKTSIQ